MKQELFNIGKKIAFNAGKYMPKALIGVSAGASIGAVILAFQAGMEFQRLKDSGEEITAKDYARIFLPTVAAEVFALACEFAGLSESERRYAAAATLASVYESKEKDIDAKAREIFGDKEVDKMHEEIIKDKLDNAPEPTLYDGTAFLDLLTGQYIYMGMEDIKARINKLNDRINNDYSVSKDEWCDIFDEMSTTADMEMGWNSKLTGIIKYDFVFKELASGRTVAALEVTEPKLFYEEEINYNSMVNPGWSEV